MLNLLHRSKTWAIASVFITTALSAQQNKNQTLSSYSAPANIDLRNSWDVYATGSFIYWQASQENIEIGLISETAQDFEEFPFDTSYVNNAKITSPNFTFRPGFKVGLGANLNWDGWDAYAEYTQFHGSTKSEVKPLTPSTLVTIPDGQYLYPNQWAPVNTRGIGIVFAFLNATQSWSLKMDLLDLSLIRAYYSGTKLTVRPFFGARGAWIRQHLSTFYGRNSTEDITGYNANISNASASWGIGPRAGFESNWMLGAGVRLIGNGSADILYTRYSLRFNQQVYDNGLANPILSNASVSQRVDYLRTHFDLEMGFGWGTYLRNNTYHIDLSATYGFQVFWSQNLFRNFLSIDMPAKSINPTGNLYVQGLTMNARFDF